MAEGVLTNNQRGRRSGPCRLWGGLDKARHKVPTALLVRVQCFREGLYKAVIKRPSTRPIVLSMINVSYCCGRRRLTILNPTRRNSVYLWPFSVGKLYHRRRQGKKFLLTNILGSKYRQISTEVRSLNVSLLVFYVTCNDISVKCVTAQMCRRTEEKFYLRLGSQRHRNFVCFLRYMLMLMLNWLFNVTINDISVIYVTAHRCAGGLKKFDLRAGSQHHRHFVGFLNVPVQAPTRGQPFYTIIVISITLCQQFWSNLEIFRLRLVA